MSTRQKRVVRLEKLCLPPPPWNLDRRRKDPKSTKRVSVQDGVFFRPWRVVKILKYRRFSPSLPWIFSFYSEQVTSFVLSHREDYWKWGNQINLVVLFSHQIWREIFFLFWLSRSISRYSPFSNKTLTDFDLEAVFSFFLTTILTK